MAVRPTYNGKLDTTLNTLKEGYKRIGDANMNNNKAFFSNQTFYINGERYTTRVYYADSAAFKDALIGYTPKPASYRDSPFFALEAWHNNNQTKALHTTPTAKTVLSTCLPSKRE